ncbi:MAG TPA: aminotransferase class V-fold PLP-dependent enzyme [Gaiellaceae bacterium]|nr:aminotransferase class V-fold PLP-dependent enzyme [Gaiellaceae bacterium]
MAELHEYRERFPILAETTYLINHSLGAMPAAAEERVLEYARAWNTRGVRAWEEGWWDLPLTVGDQIARLIGAPPGSVSMHQNVTIAEAVVVSCFGFDGPRRRVVYEEGNFPSVRYLYQAQRGADILVAADAEGVVEAIDERTLLVPVLHVLYKTGEIQDVQAIVDRAHDVGALVVLDAYQSAGTVPLDVTALGVDFAVGGSVKWLCGGPGAAWLYVRPELAATLEPALTGWQAHARPFAFEAEQDYAEGAARFLTGTPNVPALYAATAGYDVIEEVGVERIRRRSREQTALLHELLDDAGLPAGGPRDPERRGGTVVVEVPGSKRVNRELEERGVICDWRPDVGLRLGPHFFNSDDELRFAVEQIVELSRAGRSGAARMQARSARPRA